MASFNKVLLLGNLTRDPEVRYTPKGSAVADLGLAVNRTYTTEGGEKREEVTFVDVTFWGRTAEVAGEYLKKGRSVFIEGRLQLDTWDDKQSGQKRSKLKVIGEMMQMLGSRPGGSGGSEGEEGERPARSGKNCASRQKRLRTFASRTTTRFRFRTPSVILSASEGAPAASPSRSEMFRYLELLHGPRLAGAPRMNPTEACIALNMLATMGPVRLRKLLEVFETPEKVLSARGSELRAVEGIGGEVADQIVNWEKTVDLSAELKRIHDFGAEVITSASASYPRQLREIHSAPIVLYVWGELTERDQHAIGVIGSRRTTHYGTESAKKLSYQLAYAGLTVISGLARGIDTAAHQGALAAKGRTIAVIGSGLMKLYPPENAALAEKIRSGNGAIVSEFSMEIEPDRQTFPMRNRIISGWSHGILVVEAGPSTAVRSLPRRRRSTRGRSVYAVPGHINAPSAQGSNRLIQQGAKLVMDASDILDDLQVLLPETKPSPEAAARPLPELTDDERRVYDAIEATETPDRRDLSKMSVAKCDRLFYSPPP